MDATRRLLVTMVVATGYGAVALDNGVSGVRLYTILIGSGLAAFGILTPMDDAVASTEGIRHVLVTRGLNAVLVLGLLVMLLSLVT